MKHEEHPSVKAVLESANLKMRHLRDENGRPWGTVVILETTDKTIIAGSSCHKKDTFHKKTGAHIAKQRAYKALAETLGLEPEHNNPMVMVLDRKLEDGERPSIATIHKYPEPSGLGGPFILDAQKSVVLTKAN